MKYLFAITILISTTIFLSNYITESKYHNLPEPIQTIIVEEGKKVGSREDFIEQMHTNAPGINWRTLDADYRLKRANKANSENKNQRANIYGKWTEVGSNNQAGRTLVADLDQEENKIFVASDGGQIWKGDLGDENWESITDHFRIPAMHFIRNLHEEGLDRLLVGAGVWGTPGIMFSDDDGSTWQQATGLENIVNWGYIRRVVMKKDPNEGIFLVSQEWDYGNSSSMSCIYVSYDLGESFQKLHSFQHGANLLDIWTNKFGNGDVFVLDVNSIYLLNENEELELMGQVTANEPNSVYLVGTAIDGDYALYSMLYTNSVSRFYSSFDEGNTWEMKGDLSFGPFMIGSFAASPVTPGLLYFGGVNAYTSIDHGQNWDLVNNWSAYYNDPEGKLHADIPSFNSFILNSGIELLFVNTDGGIYMSLDGAENVLNISLNNLRISQYYSSYTCRFAPEYTHAGAQDQGYQFSDEGGSGEVLNYEQVISGDYGHIVSGDDGVSVWMVYPGFAMYSPDANNYGGLKFWNFVGSNYQWMPELMADPEDPSSVYIAGGSISSGAHQIHLTYSNNQMTYTEEPFDFSNGTGANISAMAFSPLNGDYRYVMTSERDFFYSMDAGDTWIKTEAFDSPGSHYFYGADIEPSKNTEGFIYVGGSGYSSPPVYVSTDNGLTFSDYSNGLPETLVFDLALSANDSLLFAATEVGAFVCKTAEGNWYDLNDDVLPDQTYWAVDFVEILNVARFSSYGRGIWDFDLDPDVEADFIADKEVVNQQESVQFTDLTRWKPISWEWVFEGGTPETSTAQNPEVFYNEPGMYSVTLIVSNDNSSDTIIKTDYIEVLPFTGIIGTKKEIEITVYPNPATEKVNIKSKTIIQEITLINLGGHLVQHLDVNSKDVSMDLNDIPNGTYMLKVKTEKGFSTEKLIKY